MTDKYTIWVLRFLIAYFTVALITGCYTQKKAQEQVNKANDKYPEVVGKLARDLYPCTDLLKPDTLIVHGDTIIMVECPEMELQSDYTPAARRGDTLRLPGKIIRVPVTLPVQTRYITNWYEDSAKIKLAALELTKSMKEIGQLKTELTAMTGSRNWYRRYFWWLILAVVILGVFSAYKIFK